MAELQEQRLTARIEKLRAEARKANAEALKAEAEAAKAAAEAAQAEIVLAERRRAETETLTGDKFYRIYRFNAPVSASSVQDCLGRLNYWNRTDPGCAIEIIFCSPGGSVIDGMVLYDYLQALRAQGHHVTTSTMGMAASMAGILLQAGDTRVMHREAWMLIHEMSFGAIGKMGDIEDTVDWAKRIQERILDIFAARCKLAGENGTARKPLTRAQLKKRWTRKDWWLASSECLELGLVDAIR